MGTEFRGRVTALLVAASLVGGAVVVRVWLAATGGYRQESSLLFRVASGIALFAGLLLAALTVAWPMRRLKAYRQHSAAADPTSASSPGKAGEDDDT